MRVRWIGLTLALALVGAAAGYGIGVLTVAEPTTFAVARPVPAQSPSIPIEPTRPFAPDIDYPALAADLEYTTHRIGTAPYVWTYDAPKGWVATLQDLYEIRWRPADEPVIGGFSLRVKLISERKTTAQMVEQKRVAVLGLYDDVVVSAETEDGLAFTYREPEANTLRYDIFRWFASPGTTEADFEMSVVGREVDEVGLQDLVEHVAASVTKQS